MSQRYTSHRKELQISLRPMKRPSTFPVIGEMHIRIVLLFLTYHIGKYPEFDNLLFSLSCSETGNLCCWQKCKTVLPPWREVYVSSKIRPSIQQFNFQEINLEIHWHKNMKILTYKVNYWIAKDWKQLKCSSIWADLKKPCYSHTMEYYVAVKRNSDYL